MNVELNHRRVQLEYEDDNLDERNFDAILKFITEIRARFAGAGPGVGVKILSTELFLDVPTNVTDGQLVDGIKTADPTLKSVRMSQAA